MPATGSLKVIVFFQTFVLLFSCIVLSEHRSAIVGDHCPRNDWCFNCQSKAGCKIGDCYVELYWGYWELQYFCATPHQIVVWQVRLLSSDYCQWWLCSHCVRELIMLHRYNFLCHILIGLMALSAGLSQFNHLIGQMALYLINTRQGNLVIIILHLNNFSNSRY